MRTRNDEEHFWALSRYYLELHRLRGRLPEQLEIFFSPTFLISAKIKKILIRVLFPPIILLDLLKYIAKYLDQTILNNLTGNIILPAQKQSAKLQFSKRYDSDFYQLENKKKLLFQYKLFTMRFHLITPQAKLDTFEIFNTRYINTPIQDQKFIIEFTGNHGCYEMNMDEMLHKAYQLNCNVIGFNYRGVHHSSGAAKSQNDLVQDGIAQVQALLKLGVKHITLDGYSLGGAVAAMVCAHFLKQGIILNLFVDRSPANLTEAAVARVPDLIPLAKSYVAGMSNIPVKMLATIGLRLAYKPRLLHKIIAGWLFLTDWEMNVTKAFDAMPHKHKDYVVAKEDRVVKYAASLHQGLKKRKRRQHFFSSEAWVQQKTTHKISLDPAASLPPEYAHAMPLSQMRVDKPSESHVATGDAIFSRFFTQANQHTVARMMMPAMKRKGM